MEELQQVAEEAITLPRLGQLLLVRRKLVNDLLSMRT
jgi:hypothetical protein